jgi:hypothetical protein
MYGTRLRQLPHVLTEPMSVKMDAIELVLMRGNGHSLDKSELSKSSPNRDATSYSTASNNHYLVQSLCLLSVQDVIRGNE